MPAIKNGVLTKRCVAEGASVKTGDLLAILEEGVAVAAKTATVEAPKVATGNGADLSPAVRRLVGETGVDPSQLSGSGKGGRITPDDVKAATQVAPTSVVAAPVAQGARAEERVPMSRLRARIAERLVQVQHEAAILTTFNEVNMKPVMDLRQKYKDAFEKAQGARLGFMSFFVKAAVEALKRFPAVNASLDGDTLVYHHFCDVGVAIGSERGLVVPILRNAELMSMADIEKAIRHYSDLAQKGKLTLEDLQGGTFTITNGGTFGSMLSTPIINPPQTAILGMHNIVDRPIAENGQVVIRPIMYVALSYDHRVIDGREAVLFLRTIKEALEDPARLLLGV
ncbi:MAG: dihydrolipoamide succinyltransferase [Gammaproteobacteria bacterium RIFCSPHIGHO2_12_FULL_45_9]|nr:MAG: dihydrolipoamide succinyltransferase [Gammaproteobacteria bacterium RIFCSPHIGHO2_12_FULL_45_9]